MRILFLMVILVCSSKAMAWHTTGGKVGNINVYASTDIVLVTLINANGNVDSGEDVAECSNKKTFAISHTLPAERRQQMLSVLLMAKASGRSVQFAYSKTWGCVAYGPNPNAYRGITRIIL